ncbi:HK97 gp10 family phage protein [Ensifer sp. ENS09]|uniref:HK97-gp10 family putative phage morphogenesis protein n=1 Tax=Ensifer sp. ENS09 TaxID=2769263 RepID=UPI00177CC136|nr:HK97-gp10 family putative phage morphogenesis protein [Ensifer sp. ENS09]MBD9652000.1 HK97 gp10 family phage protein [Ensifer sp. ENS09]
MTKILNLAKLDKKLKRLPTVAKEFIRAEMGKVADQVVEMMKRLVPVEDGVLSDSIGWTWGKAPKGASIVATVESKMGADLTITIYAGSVEAYYARWQEFGTQDLPAQPFFYVSWRASRKDALRQVRKASRQAAKKVAAS